MTWVVGIYAMNKNKNNSRDTNNRESNSRNVGNKSRNRDRTVNSCKEDSNSRESGLWTSVKKQQK